MVAFDELNLPVSFSCLILLFILYLTKKRTPAQVQLYNNYDTSRSRGKTIKNIWHTTFL